MFDPKNKLNSNLNNASKKSVVSCRRVDSVFRRSKIIEKKVEGISETKTDIITENKIKTEVDDNKRLFLKVAGMAGLGLAASALFPKGAEAYVSGSTPTSNVVGVKDHDNLRIDPTKEQQLPAALTTSGNLKVAVLDSLPTGTNTIGSVNLMDVVVLLKSLLNVIANPSYVDKSANQMRVQATLSSGTVTTVTTVATVTGMTNVDSYQGKLLMINNNNNAWANVVRTRIS
jgi:hypothetical protein